MPAIPRVSQLDIRPGSDKSPPVCFVVLNNGGDEPLSPGALIADVVLNTDHIGVLTFFCPIIIRPGKSIDLSCLTRMRNLSSRMLIEFHTFIDGTGHEFPFKTTFSRDVLTGWKPIY